jgi:hypothetical protein
VKVARKVPVEPVANVELDDIGKVLVRAPKVAQAADNLGFIGVQLDNATCYYPHPAKPGSRPSPLLHDQPEVQ